MGGLVDNSRLERRQAVWLVCCIVFILASPPMINYKIFIPWDLTFGSGMQALGSLLAVLTSVWFVKRAEALKELSLGRDNPFPAFLYWWVRLVIPIAILFVGFVLTQP